MLANALPKFEGLGNLRARKDVFARHYQVDRILRRMLSAEARPFSRSAVAELFAQWGDPLSQAEESYVSSCLAHAQSTSGHILQCGTGLLTLLLGIVCARNAASDQHLWCLVDDRHWAGVMRSWLTQYQVANAHVVLSRPRIFENCVWYALDPAKVPDNFSLALCDGGRASVNGAVGLLERMGLRLRSDCVILARHVTLAKDQALLQRWADRRGVHCTLVEKSTGFLKIVRGDGRGADTVSPALP